MGLCDFLMDGTMGFCDLPIDGIMWFCDLPIDVTMGLLLISLGTGDLLGRPTPLLNLDRELSGPLYE